MKTTFGTPVPNISPKERVLTPEESARWAISDECKKDIEELEQWLKRSAIQAKDILVD
jgi:hypothetical protein